MKTRIIMAFGAVALVIAGSFYAFSQTSAQDQPADGAKPRLGRGFGGPHQRGGMMLGRLARHLDLSDGQKAQIKSLAEAERERVKPFAEQLREAHQAWREATAKGQFNEAQVRALAQSQTQARVELTVSRARLQSAIYQVLTPEQRAKLEQMRDHVKERRHPRRSDSE
jgi:Spy/CpxP family protein refolding chaperone